MGQRLLDEMEKYNHQVGLKIVGECLPRKETESATDQAGTNTASQYRALPIRFCENDKKLIKSFVGVYAPGTETRPEPRDIWDETDDTCHLNGTARMGQ